MRGYLSAVHGGGGAVVIDERVAVFRNPGDDHEIVARKTGEKLPLGISDVTVSRPKEGTPPVVFEPRQSCIEIRNRRNANAVTVICESGRQTVERGRTERISDSAKVEVGYQAEFHLRVKQEAKREINVDGSVAGDVVAGDQTSIDRSTTVDDSVVNRSDVDGDGGATVEDSVVNRSSVGESETDEDDTKNHCSTHDRFYEGDVCPECAAVNAAETGNPETEFCMDCGTEVSSAVAFCPACGEEILRTLNGGS